MFNGLKEEKKDGRQDGGQIKNENNYDKIKGNNSRRT
jgi:hypothetical protein